MCQTHLATFRAFSITRFTASHQESQRQTPLKTIDTCSFCQHSLCCSLTIVFQKVIKSCPLPQGTEADLLLATPLPTGSHHKQKGVASEKAATYTFHSKPTPVVYWSNTCHPQD